MRMKRFAIPMAVAIVMVACDQQSPTPIEPQNARVVAGEQPGDVAIEKYGGSAEFLRASGREGESSDMTRREALLNDIAFAETRVRTDFVVTGVGNMRNFGAPRSFPVSGISGTITKATLYWHGITNTLDPLAGAFIKLNGAQVSGHNIGFSSDNCWGYQNSQAWAADVTSIVSGNGTYTISDYGYSNPVNLNGASLIVFFDDGDDSNDRDAVIFEGNDSNINNAYDAPGWNVTLAGINYSGGNANMQLHVADGQPFPDDRIVVNGNVLVQAGPTFDGNTVSGGLWDIRSFNVTGLLTPGPNTLSLTSGVYSDCLALVVAIVDLPAGAAPPPPNSAPEVTLNGPYNGDEGTPVSFNFSSSDADGDALSFSYDFGDGTTGTSSSLPAAHTYADDGTYTVTVTATDDDGATATATTQATIKNVAPMIYGGPDLTIFYGETATLAGTLSDPGADAPWAYAIDWGNGTGSGALAATGAISLTRVYAAPGTYHVEISVDDGDGGKHEDDIVITVLNRAPIAHAGAAQVVQCTQGGAQVTLDGSASLDPDPTGQIVSYAWTPTASGVSPTLSFGLGSHVVGLTVTDDFGATGAAQTTVDVVDTGAPSIALSAPIYFWPPNHKYAQVNLGFSMSDACANASNLTAVATAVSNEADDANGAGDGNTTGDIKVTRANGQVVFSSNAAPTVTFNPATDRLEVRVERFGTAAPREYTIRVDVTDASGNTASATTKVVIDHNR